MKNQYFKTQSTGTRCSENDDRGRKDISWQPLSRFYGELHPGWGRLSCRSVQLLIRSTGISVLSNGKVALYEHLKSVRYWSWAFMTASVQTDANGEMNVSHRSWRLVAGRLWGHRQLCKLLQCSEVYTTQDIKSSTISTFAKARASPVVPAELIPRCIEHKRSLVSISDTKHI